MKTFILLFNLALKNVTRKTERTVLTVIGILLAVAATMTLLSLSEGLHWRIQQEVSNRDVDLYISPRSALPLPMGAIGPMGLSSEFISRKETEQISVIPNVLISAPITRLIAKYQNTTLIFWGIDPEKFTLFFPKLTIASGHIFTNKPQLVLGGALAGELNLSLGSTFTMGGIPFSTVGITGKTGGFEEYFGYISLKQALKAQKIPGYQEIWIKIEDSRRLKETQKRIQELFPHLAVRTAEEFLGVSVEFVRTAKVLQFAIAGIGILISIAASMNTMLMSTYERMKEFATLRAIGAPRSFVFTIVAAESIILAAVGGIIGIVVGLFTTYIFNKALVALFQLSFPLALITPSLIGQSLLVSIVVGVMGALIPATIVYSINVVKGLRWE